MGDVEFEVSGGAPFPDSGMHLLPSSITLLTSQM